MSKKKNRGNDRSHKGGKPKKNLEEQAQDIMRSSDLEELEKAEIPEEFRSRLEGADVAALDDLEEELRFDEDEGLSEEETAAGPVTQQTLDTEEHVEQPQEGIDASCVVKISDDRMSALISLYPSQHGGKPVDFATVKKELDSAGVVFGVNEELLKKLIITVEKTHEEKEGVIIAKGLLPEEGKDGLIEYYFGEDEALFDQDDGEQENE